jgi:restriction endonuclease S subunit
MENIEEKIEKIHNQIFHKRLNRNKSYDEWKLLNRRDFKGTKIDDKIRELLEKNYKVTGGYFATAVRGYYEYYLMYK